MAKAVVKTPEEAMKKWEEKFSRAASKIVARATSPEATEAYKRNLAAFLGLSPEQISDEAMKRNESLKKITPEKLRAAVAGKGKKWYENLKLAFAD